MTRMWKGRRILSLVLALAMIVTMLPSMALPIYSEDVTDQTETSVDTTEASADTPNYGALVGATAQFNIAAYLSFAVDNDPATFNDDFYEGEWATHENYLYYDPDAGQCDFDADLTLVITDWYANPTTFGLWFKVEAASGHTLPEMLVENPWIFHNWYDIYAEEDWEEISYDALVITVPDGVYDPATGITVTGDLPDNASISVTIPEIDGAVLPNVFDIKVLVPNAEGELVGWQPIDEGKTVTISIPVEGDVATVTHFVDYDFAVKNTPNIEYLSLEGATAEELALFEEAIAASDREGYVAVEIIEKEIENGVVTFAASSFSAYIADGTDTQHKAIWVNNNYSETESVSVGVGNPFTGQEGMLSCVSAGVVYVDEDGSEITGGDQLVRVQTLWDGAAEGNYILGYLYASNCKVDMHYSIDGGETWTDMDAKADIGNPGTGRQPVARGDIPSDAFNAFDIGLEIWVVLTDKSSSPTKYIFLRMTKVNTPDAGSVKFIDNNGNQWGNIVDNVLDTSENGTKGGALPNPTDSSNNQGATFTKPGYSYDGWKVIAITENVPGRGWVLGNVYEEYPAFRHGHVTLEPQWTPASYTITYDPGEGTMPDSYATAYTIESIVDLPIPTRDGYTFTGWTPNDIGNWGTTEIPRGSSVQGKYGSDNDAPKVTLTAGWSENSGIAYTVRHIYEGLPGQEDEVYEEILYGKTNDPAVATARQTVGFTAKSFETPKIAGDESTVVEIEYARNEYLVTWNTNGGAPAIEPVSYKYGETITVPTETNNLQKEGYDFAGWNGYTQGMTMPDNPVTFTALWSTEVYTITFYDSDGTTKLYTSQFAYNATVNLPTPIKTGNTFTGWYDSDGYAVVSAFDMPAKDIDLYATWEVNQYTITFDSNGGVAVSPVTCNYGAILTGFAVPTREGHTFDGWAIVADNTTTIITDKEGNISLPDGSTQYAMPATNITLVAQWTINSYTITFVNENGEVLQSSKWEYGTTPSYTGETPAKAATAQYSYTFAGWTPAISAVTGEATYTATYTATVNEYTITFKNEDGTVLQSGKVAYGEMPVYNGETPTKAATAQYTYTFAGWTPEIVSVVGEAVYTAIFKPEERSYTITWVNYDGTVLEEDEDVLYGKTPTYDGNTPVKAGNAQYSYTFNGWTTAISPVTGNATYTAAYTETVNKYTITFVDEDGTTVLQSSQWEYGAMPSCSGTPTKAATAQYTYTFAGWDKEIVAVTGEAIYKATYTATVNTYTVIWKNWDGTVLETDENVPYGATPSHDGETPVKAADEQYTYTFTGWHPVLAGVTGDATYTALYDYEANEYTITYNLDGGVVVGENPTTYTVESDAITLINPTKEGFNFVGWTGTGLSGATMDVTIPAGSTGDRSYTATWERALTTLTIKVEGCDTQLDAKQSFIFTVTSNTTGENVEVDVAVVGNGHVCISGLVIGNSYTITMQTSWSWRYEVVTGSSVTMWLKDGETIVFTVQRNNSQWLDWFGGLFSNGN